MALLGLFNASGQKPVVAHFNHLLRGEESDGDERFVREEAERRGLEFRAGRGDVRAEAKGISIEMAARKLRHAFLAEVAKEVGGEIVLAHHADDQIELVLLRARRRIEGYGASGMREESVSPADSSVRVLRPVLHMRRHELREFLETKRIPFREDRSNAELNAQRNWIRHKTIPVLREHFGPEVEAAILEHAQSLRNLDDMWRRSADAWVEGNFNALPDRLRKEIVVTQLERLGMTASGKVLEPILESAGKPVMIAPGILVRMDWQGRLQLVKKSEPVVSLLVDLRREGKATATAEFGAFKFSWSFKSLKSRDAYSTDGEMVFDAGKIGNIITLRNPQAGDRVRLSGRSSTRPLLDVLGRNKVPNEKRAQAIVAVTEHGEIFWVEGLRIVDGFKLTEHTETALEWRWERMKVETQ